MYSPAQICEAAGSLKPPTLRGWHNTDGLTVGEHQPNGRRAYAFPDAALVVWVAMQTGASVSGGESVHGYMQHHTAVRIANALRAPLASLWNGYRDAFGIEVLSELDAIGPVALATPGPTLRVEFFATRGDWVGALVNRGGNNGQPLPSILIDVAALFKAANSRLPAVGKGSEHE